MTNRIDVFFKLPGVTEEQKMTHFCHPMGAMGRTKRANPRGYDFRTISYHDNYKRKFIPAPPEGWEFTRFKTVMKKNRFGRLVNAKAEELDYDD